MTDVPRIDPHRQKRLKSTGRMRTTITPRSDPKHAAKQKPVRCSATPTAWLMSIVHSGQGTLDEHAREAIAAATILAGPTTGVIAVVLGSLEEDVTAYGADLVVAINDQDAARFDPETRLLLIETLIAAYAPHHIFMPNDALGSGDLGRRLIAKTNLSAATRVAEISATHAALEHNSGHLTRTVLPRIVLLNPGAVDTKLPFRGRGELAPAPAIAGRQPSPYRDLGIKSPAASALALDDADLVVSAGHGVANTETVQRLADKLGAAVGASRVAVDEGKYPRDRQVGATGKTLTARGYVAVGISGAVQHLQGIASCRHVVAINKDAGAPIVKRADLTLVGDAEDIMQAFIARIDQAHAQREMPETS